MTAYAGRTTRFVHAYFHALTHRNYRTFWLGQCVSLIGTWVQNVSQAWLVLSLTKSPLLLGMLGLAQFLPLTVLSLFAGVIVDKFPKKTILMVTQTIAMTLAFTTAVLVFTGTIRFEHILVMAFLLGVSNTFDMPTRQSMNIELVGRDDLMNAVALNSMTFNLARIVGPSVGTLLIATVGVGWCYVLNGTSFIVVLLTLRQLKLTPFIREVRVGSTVWSEIRDGLSYIRSNAQLAQTVLLVAIVGTLGFNFNVLVPVLTQDVLGAGATTYGALMSCLGVGSLIGALTIGMRSRRGPKLKLTVALSMVIPLGLLLLAIAQTSAVAGVMLLISGFLNIAVATNSNSLLQISAADEYRARVMSVYTLVFAGSTPFGNLFTGWAADKYGVHLAFLFCGLLSLALGLAVVYAFRARSRREPLDGRAASRL
ncbi:MFS transporter [Cohnella yongneupensis]|uniref:MFS transporter n=1 Tax=Cohnella yongneupensis TaxID=425006 RepID=A0ABW0R4F2_9BACL